MLKMFGSDALVLRAPSLLSACLLYVFSAMLLRIRGFGFIWQIGAVFIIFGQSELMYYAGEARPYMPLATATVGTVVYAVASAEQRKQWSVRCVGFFSIALGVLMHPYFSVYWASAFLFGFWFAWLRDEVKLTPRDFMTYLNLPLCLIGTAAFFLLASQTWLAGSPVFDRNPFQFMQRAEIYRLFVYNQTTFLGVYSRGQIFLVLCAAISTLYIFCPEKLKRIVKPVVPPAVLVCLALTLTVAVSVMSYYQNYWILTRQWLASIALVGVGFTWFSAEFVRMLASRAPVKFQQMVATLVILCIGVYCWRASEHNAQTRWRAFVEYTKMPLVKTLEAPPKKILCPLSPERWIDLANDNAKAGEDVWPVFKYYYLADQANPYCQN
jgi:hypothetical protein